MKPIVLIPPILSFVIGVGWIGTQRMAISSLEDETTELRDRIDALGNGRGEAGEQSLAMRMKEEAASEGDGIDWKDLAEKLAGANRGQMRDMRAMMELQTALMEMDADDLLAELAKIEALDLNNEARRALESMLIGMLAQKDPQVVLERYMERVNDDQGGMSWQLSSAFQQWQEKEPVAALTWLDAEIAKGTFESKSLDGKNRARVRFESAVIVGLLSKDPAAAKERMMAFPEDQRLEFFNQGMLVTRQPGSEKAFAELARSVLPEDQWGDAYRNSVGNLMRQGGFDKVDDLITEIEAGGKERESIVDHAVNQRVQKLGQEGKLDREAVDELREWASTQAPDRVDGVTGEALGKIWGNKSKIEERVRIVEALHDEGAGDELIISFIGDRHRGAAQQEAMRPLLDRISDEEVRQEAIDRLDGKSTPTPPSSSEVIEESE
ncbi:hypothetical protein [Haloferula sp.]|uniref:hypothetical protein n=1 Tax=Haloferula sp. TaxID=2497595 RepID=UPI00329E8D6D